MNFNEDKRIVMNYAKATFTLLLYLLILFSYIFTKGFYSYGGSTLILISILLFIGIFRIDKSSIKFTASHFKAFLSLMLLISIVLSMLLYGGMYQQVPALIGLSKILLMAVTGLTVFSFFPIKNNPFYGLITSVQMYVLCILLLVPALVFYIINVLRYRKTS